MHLSLGKPSLFVCTLCIARKDIEFVSKQPLASRTPRPTEYHERGSHHLRMTAFGFFSAF
jgi:hypothetical protein